MYYHRTDKKMKEEGVGGEAEGEALIQKIQMF